jgi:catechol 2,3-dioxygenase-like lactoylglutathione lyase family enzyme
VSERPPVLGGAPTIAPPRPDEDRPPDDSRGIHGLGYPPRARSPDVAATVSGIGHIVIPVHDMQLALGFYRDALGFGVVGEENPVWTVVDAKGASLTLFLQDDSPRIALGKDGDESPFFFHVSNFLDSATELEKRGFRVKRLDGNQGIVWDPSGNVLGLHDHRTESRSRRSK